jgi:iron complex transport system permease protein
VKNWKQTLIYILPVPVIIISLFVGPSSGANPLSIINWLTSYFAGNADTDYSIVSSIVIDVRLPRILLTFLVGASLSASGTSLQALFRNPLVSPYIIGISSGAAFGAAIALATAFLPIQPVAFFFGIIAVVVSYLLARKGRTISIVSLLLTGVIVSSIFTALLAVVQFIADPFKLQSIVHWTLGNLHNATWAKVKSSLLPVSIGMIWLYIMRWRINVLALGDEEAMAVGVNPEIEKILVLVPATLIASASVAVAGVIGMIDLAVPHMVRMILGSDNSKVLPASFVFGGTFLLLVDDLSRSVMPFELPIGIFTMLIGGPLFIYLLKKNHLGMRE